MGFVEVDEEEAGPDLARTRGDEDAMGWVVRGKVGLIGDDAFGGGG